MSQFKKFLIQFGHFLTGGIFSQLLGFITFPILTRILTQEQYGIMGLITITMLLAVAIAKAGLSNGIIRYYEEYRNSSEKQTVFASTVLIRGLLLSTITVSLYLFLMRIGIYSYFGIDNKFSIYFNIMAVYLFVRPLSIIILNLLRVNGKTLFLNILGLSVKIISIGTSLLLLVFVFKDLYGYFLGYILGEIIFLIFLFVWFFSNYKISFKHVSKELSVKLIKFGSPLLFTELSYLLLSYADRYMITMYYGADALGLYSVGYNLAMYIADIITVALSYAIVPLFVETYEKSGKKETEEFLQKTLHYLLIGILPVCFGYYAISRELFIFVASNKYATASNFSYVILVGTILLGMNNFFNAGLFLKKKSTVILGIMLLSVFLNIILNIMFLPDYGVMGAAVATLIACVISTILTIYLSYKYIIIRFDSSFFYYLFISLCMAAVIMQINISSVGLNLLVRILLGILIIIPGILLKEKELTQMVKKLFYIKRIIK